MELYMCGFNAHHQLLPNSGNEILQFTKILRSPRLAVRCALWSSVVIENDAEIIHRGFRLSGVDPIMLEGPPARNMKTVFGDTSGVLGALTTDGSLYILRDEPAVNRHPELKRHHFNEETFIHTQHLAIDHIAIADNCEVCIITNSCTRNQPLSASTPRMTDSATRFTFTAPSARLEIHTFASFEKFISAKPPTFTLPLFSSIVSLVASATSFAALTSNGEVLTFGSALHPQVLGRTPIPSSPANVPAPVTFLGGIPIRKIAIGGWLAAAVSEDNDLYIWGGQASEAQKVSVLPKASGGEEVRLVDIDGGVDVIDVGVGSGHMLALTRKGDLWAIGEGDYGQLGTGRRAFEESWVKVNGEGEGKGRIIEVGCGVWSSWVIVDAG